MSISQMYGKTLASVTIDSFNDEIAFVCTDGTAFRMWHRRDCCEGVSIESVVGDLADLVGSPILMAEESSSDALPGDVPAPQYAESQTWTFYKLATIKGYVDIRWFGSSNGNYSERVDFERVS